MSWNVQTVSVRLLVAVFLLSLSGATGAEAQEVSRVLELFTSQSCPRCPPADRLVANLARDPATVVLSFPVAYWDYGGWKDTLATSLSARRQRDYAHARGDNLIYTPQIVVDGLKACPGGDGAALARMSEAVASRENALRVPSTADISEGRLHIRLGEGATPAGGSAGVYVLRVARTEKVVVGRGANTGQELTYVNVVRAMSRIGSWDGRSAEFDLVDLKAMDEGYIVLIQSGSTDAPGLILAAAKTDGL